MTDDVDIRSATAPTDAGRPARARSSSLLDDEQRAAFLTEWKSVQSCFAADPPGAVEAAERLVTAVVDEVVRRVGEIAEAVGRPGPDSAGGSIGEEESLRQRLLRCLEAFHLLIDS